MALTNLEFTHIRLMRKARSLVERRLTLPMATSLATPAFFDAVISEKTGLFSTNDLDKIGSLNISADRHQGYEIIGACIISKMSTLALYPDRLHRRASKVPRSFGMVPDVPLPEDVQNCVRLLAVMIYEYVSVNKVIGETNLEFSR